MCRRHDDPDHGAVAHRKAFETRDRGRCRRAAGHGKAEPQVLREAADSGDADSGTGNPILITALPAPMAQAVTYLGLR